ncbi:hypothetical protein [Arcobacter ellisii]|uniref:Uncharacterized protein n=1 Tax=Arcobacter ellisii TaxID=913109 RepID=A0A347U8E1_9BACT|nr:hypothetical protein [Arcobacter ellisii]AXX95119.1 hypothetical protein AELL_1457 [Arcobacter ellisii]RXI29007.1 hypothetical protein CP962_12365 [Arcobacter ellisii]
MSILLDGRYWGKKADNNNPSVNIYETYGAEGLRNINVSNNIKRLIRYNSIKEIFREYSFTINLPTINGVSCVINYDKTKYLPLPDNFYFTTSTCNDNPNYLKWQYEAILQGGGVPLCFFEDGKLSYLIASKANYRVVNYYGLKPSQLEMMRLFNDDTIKYIYSNTSNLFHSFRVPSYKYPEEYIEDTYYSHYAGSSGIRITVYQTGFRLFELGFDYIWITPRLKMFISHTDVTKLPIMPDCCIYDCFTKKN